MGAFACIQGFRKVDTDKWEFANEWFMRGQRHLLKNIERRKSAHSQHIGSSSGSSEKADKSALQGEIECLRKERSLMMKEVVELQHQQRGTVQHMKVVNEKLQTTERRHKQMVSFLGKLFRNPEFLARLQETKEQQRITAPKTTRKFLKHQAHEPGTSDSVPRGQIVKYQQGLGSYIMRSSSQEPIPVMVKQLPDYPFQDMGDRPVFGTEHVQVEDTTEDGLTKAREFLSSPDQAEAVSILRTIDPYIKGKDVLGPQLPSTSEYFISFPDEMVKEKSVPELSISEAERMATEEGIWSMGFETGAGMSSSVAELWDNMSTYDVPELGSLSDDWDIGSLQPARNSGIEKRPDDDSPVKESQNQEGQPRDDSSV